MSDSVGKITLDLEIKSDINKQISAMAGVMAKQLKTALSTSVDKAMKEAGKSTETAMKSLGKSITETMAGVAEKTKTVMGKIGENLKESVKAALDSIKNYKQPAPVSQPDSNTAKTQDAQSGEMSIRGSPTSLSEKLPTLDLSGFKKAVSVIGGVVGKVSILKLSLKGVSAGFKLLGKGISAVGKLAQTALSKISLSKIISQTKEGLKNLSQYSGQVNSSMSSLTSSLEQLKNSLGAAFAPLLNVVAPILSKLINMLSQAITYVGMFFAALTGQSTFTKAKAVQKDYAASLNNSTNNAKKAAKATKEYQKQLMGFDEINKVGEQNQDDDPESDTDYGGPSVSDMFETVNIDGWAKDLANQVKDLADRIFEPIRQAWEDYGDNFVEAWKRAFTEVKAASYETAKTFLDAWENGWGYTTVTNLLKLLTSIGNLIADIAAAWRDAWAVKGEALVESMFYALNAILVLIYEITESFRNAWNTGAGQQILEHIFQIVTNLYTIVGNLASGFTEAWKEAGVGDSIMLHILNLVNIILETIERLTGATADWAEELDFTPLLVSIDGLLESIEPLAQNIGDGLVWFYENALLPIASFVIEEAVPDFLDSLGDAIDFVDQVIESIKPGIKYLFEEFLFPVAQWTGGKIRDILKKIGEIFRQLSDVFKEKGDKVNNILVGLTDIFKFLWSVAEPILDAVMSAVLDNFDRIAIIIGGAIDIMSGLIDFIIGVFTGDWERAWQGIQDIFSGLWDAIRGTINSILGGIEKMANGVVKGINVVIKALNGLNIDIPEWVPFLGGKSFSLNIPSLSEVSLPRLETGGIIDTPTLAMVGENGQEAVVPLENNTGWLNSIAKQLADQMGAGGSGVTKEELENIMLNVANMIVSALDSLGFYIDSEEIAKATQKGMNKVNRRYNTVTTI